MRGDPNASSWYSRAQEMERRISLSEARTVMIAAQGLSPAAAGSDAATPRTAPAAQSPGAQSPDALAPDALTERLAGSGFLRTLGGVDVYLAARARVPGLSRADLDAAVAARELQVVPAVRGCIYLVPRRDVPLALRVASLLSHKRSEREQEKAGIRPGELDDVGRAVLELLQDRGPQKPGGLRRKLPKGTVRSLGSAGKKVGLSSTLPPALRRLEFTGAIERVLETGRLDSERYRWGIPERNPFEDDSAGDLPEDPLDLFARCAEIFFRGAGVGTRRDFAAWTGISQRDARAALARCSLVEREVAGQIQTFYGLEGELPVAAERLDAARRAIAFLPFEDNLIALHGGSAVLVDEAHHDVPVPVWGRGRGTTVGEARHMSFRSLVVDGRIAGFWEYDPEDEAVVFACFEPPDPSTRECLEEKATDVAAFLRDDVGHGRSFSLDTDEALSERATAIRAMAARV